ncbi:MAG: glycosyltransferase [Caldithrix sp.]|nr:glycosyltransferase [Caldithrix sp.]
MNDRSVSVVLHYTDDAVQTENKFRETINSIAIQNESQNVETIIITDKEESALKEYTDALSGAEIPCKIMKESTGTFGAQLNKAFKATQSAFILYLDNRNAAVQLKKGTVETFLLGMDRHPSGGMIYADYELEKEGTVSELHLLKHHQGRLRDNQDYGFAYFFSKNVLQSIGFADETLKNNTLYDLRLKVSEKNKIVHIANRYAGSLYRVVSEAKSHNVFDYLLADKESQLEAENVLQEHLKRIGAYMAPAAHYLTRPNPPEEAELKASVIIPVNNRPEFIGNAIESVQAQTVADVEVIVVVNGGYDDPTVEAAKRYMPEGDRFDPQKPAVRVLVYDINNLGLCLNMGARIARGAYYVQLDSDDQLMRDAVEKILKVYESDDKIGMVIGSYEVWEKQQDGQLKRMENLPVVTHDEWTEENGRNNLLRINGAGAPRSIPIALIREMEFSINDDPFARNYGEDYDMVLRISEQHRIGRVWDAIYKVIRHSGGTDHSIDQQTIDRNDEAKDFMRLEAVNRRIDKNKQ